MSKKYSIILSIIFCAFIGIISLLFAVLPKKSFSEREKRYLEETPPTKTEAILSGEFGERAESFAADHLPARDFFINVNAVMEKLFLLQSQQEIYIGRDGGLYERPVRENDRAIQTNMKAINEFALTVNRPVDLMIVPSSGFIMRTMMGGLVDPFIDDELIDGIYSLVAENVHPVYLLDEYEHCSEKIRLYYKTDHHWTSFGAYTACQQYLQSVGKSCPVETEYSVTSIPGFYGSTYSRACFWNFPSEDIELWDSRGEHIVSISGEDHEGLFYLNRLDDNTDKYPVFLDGNHPLVTVTNSDDSAEESILVIRDSFGSCFGCFLADAYKNVTLVDLRYFKNSVSELVASGNYDNVLILYSIGNFMTDSNIVWLQ